MAGAGDLDGERFCYVTTVGRRTGKPHTIEIWYASRGRTAYILMGDGERADTVRNARRRSDVTVRIGDRVFGATARVLDDPGDPEAMLARELIPQKYAHEEDGLEEWAREALPVAFYLADG